MFQSDLLKGRTIFITGGGTGLGRSMALRFAELGASLFLVGRRGEPLKEAAEAIRKKHISSFELTQQTFERIDKYNPQLNAFVTCPPKSNPVIS